VRQPRQLTPPPAIVEISEAFRALGVNELGLQAIASMGFTQPTPIQEQALPPLFEGYDVVGLAQTGTGKTLAFGMPIAQGVDVDYPHVQVLVLVPTRELAAQVLDLINHLALFFGFRAVGLVGGKSVRGDLDALARQPHVVVGTPGRVIDHMERGTLDLGHVGFVVLDEADQMLDIGFARAITRILRSVPDDRMTALFSATMPMTIRRIIYRFMRDPMEVSVVPDTRTVETVRQYYLEVAERDKLATLVHLYRTMSLGRSLVFLKMKHHVDRVTHRLQSLGIPARAIHGDLPQAQRDRVMADFRSGNLEILVATNVAARGLDIPDIQHVINYDLPQNVEEYIHRVGRTARAGKEGSAITFVAEWDFQDWGKILGQIGDVVVEPLEVAQPEDVDAGVAGGHNRQP